MSVIIVSYFSGQFIEKCLNSIFQSTYKDVEVIIVDNGSKDETKDVVRKYSDSVRAFFLEKNMGFSAANNYGAQQSSGELLFFLNHDAFVWKDCISVLVEEYNRMGENSIIVAPRLLNMDGSVQHSDYFFPNVWSVVSESLFLNYFFKEKKMQDESADYKECEAVSGAAMMMSKKRFEEIGGWDKNLFWMDDVDLCYRNFLSGGRTFQVLRAKSYHLIGGSAKKFSEKVIPNQLMSRLKFFKKHGNFFEIICVFVFLYFQAISRGLIFLLLSPFNYLYRKKCAGYLRCLILLPKTLMNDEQIVA